MFKPLIDYDYELEASVLGILIMEPDAFSKAYGMLVPECFYKPEHSQVYEAISALYTQGYAIDLHTVSRYFYGRGTTLLGDGNVTWFLATLMASVVKSTHMEDWCLMLRELAVQRTALAITTSGIDRTEDVLSVAEMVQQKLKALTDIRSSDDWEDGSKIAMKLLQHMEDMKDGGGKWISTSLRYLDELNGGFRPGQLVLIGARPAVGKSAFMGRIAVMAARSGKRCGIITLEMDSKDVFARMVSFNRDIDFYQLDRNEFYSDAERQAAFQAISDTANLPLHFSDTAQVSMRDIRAKAEKLKRRHGIDILFIDYLQLVAPDPGKQAIREQEVAKISLGSKRLARELEIPVVMLVQLNRQADAEEPKLKHLRESGSLEQDADIVMMLHRDADSEDTAVKSDATLFVRKWRNGSEAKIKLRFEGARMKFVELGEPNLFPEVGNTAAVQAAGRQVVDYTQPRAVQEPDDLPF